MCEGQEESAGGMGQVPREGRWMAERGDLGGGGEEKQAEKGDG